MASGFGGGWNDQWNPENTSSRADFEFKIQKSGNGGLSAESFSSEVQNQAEAAEQPEVGFFRKAGSTQ